MAINKVVVDGETIIDLSNDTINEGSALKGTTFHNASGELTEGTLIARKVTDVRETDMSSYLDEAEVGEIIITEKEGGGEGGTGLLPRLHIISETGSDVYVTDGGTELYPTEQSGVWEVDVPNYGVWTIHSVLNGEDAIVTLNVDTVKIYVVDDSHFSATIKVTFTEGAICFISKGSEIYYATTNPYIFSVHSKGEWLVKAVLDDVVVEQIVTITTEGQSEEIELVVARWKYEDWLSSAGITETYASLDDVLADEKTIRILFDKHASVDYLALCEDTDTIEQIMTSGYVEKWTNLCDYALDTLYAIPSFKAVMDSTKLYGYGELELVDGEYQPKGAVPIMTSNNAPYGEVIESGHYGSYVGWHAFNDTITDEDGWDNNGASGYLGYKFTNPICVKSVDIVNRSSTSGSKDFDIKYSNDGTNWSEAVFSGTLTQSSSQTEVQTFSFENNVFALYWRIDIKNNYGWTLTGLNKVQFYGRQLKVSVPKMDSNTSPWGEASANNYYDNRSYIYYAFDKSDSTFWAPKSQNENSYIQYEFPQKVVIKGLYLKAINSWTDVSTVTKVTLLGGDSADSLTEIKSFNPNARVFTLLEPIDVVKECKILRVAFEHKDYSQYLNLAELNFYCEDYSERTSRHYIYDNGLELEELDFVGKTWGSSFIVDGTFDKQDTMLNGIMPTTASHLRSFNTKNAIDFTPYNLLRVANMWDKTTYSIDLTNLNENLLVMLVAFKTLEESVHRIFINSNFSGDYFGSKKGYFNIAKAIPFMVNELWLE